MIIEYEVGQIPANALGLTIKDTNDNRVNLQNYASHDVELLGSDNEQIDLTGAVLGLENARDGVLTFIFPKDRSLFTKSGDYLLRVTLRDSEGSRDYTRALTIRVRKFGRY